MSSHNQFDGLFYYQGTGGSKWHVLIPKNPFNFEIWGFFACAEHGYQHFVASEKLFSCFPTGAKMHRVGKEHWDIGEEFGQLSP